MPARRLRGAFKLTLIVPEERMQSDADHSWQILQDNSASNAKKVYEVTACEKAIGCVRSDADCAFPTACGTCAILLVSAIKSPQAYKVQSVP